MKREERDRAIAKLSDIYTGDYRLAEALKCAIEALKAEPCERQFEKIMVEYPPKDSCTYPEYKGKPYFSIKYKENGQEFVGYGTYNPDVLSRYLRDYFIKPPVTPEIPVAHWVAVDDEPHEWYECDHCGYSFTTKSANIMPEEENKYCPNCGRRMEEGEPK